MSESASESEDRGWLVLWSSGFAVVCVCRYVYSCFNACRICHVLIQEYIPGEYVVCGPTNIEYMSKRKVQELLIPTSSVRFSQLSVDEPVVIPKVTLLRRPLVFKTVEASPVIQAIQTPMPVIQAPMPVIQAQPAQPVITTQQTNNWLPTDEIWRPMHNLVINVTRVMAQPFHVPPAPKVVGYTRILETPPFDDMMYVAHKPNIVVGEEHDEKEWLDYTFQVLTNRRKQIYPVGRVRDESSFKEESFELEYEMEPEPPWIPDAFIIDRTPFPNVLGLDNMVRV